MRSPVDACRGGTIAACRERTNCLSRVREQDAEHNAVVAWPPSVATRASEVARGPIGAHHGQEYLPVPPEDRRRWYWISPDFGGSLVVRGVPLDELAPLGREVFVGEDGARGAFGGA